MLERKRRKAAIRAKQPEESPSMPRNNAQNTTHKSPSGKAGAVSFPRLVLLLLVFTFGIAFPCLKASAQTDASITTPHISQQQTDQLLGVLNDPEKRQAFITTLQNLSDAQRNVTKASLINKGWTEITDVSRTGLDKMKTLSKTVTNFSDLLPWIHHVIQTPSVQHEIMRISIRVAILVIGGVALSYCVRLLLRTPRKTLELKAKRFNRDNIQQDLKNLKDARDAVDQQSKETASLDNDNTLNEDEAQDEAKRMQRQGAMAYLMVTLRRFPYTFGCFIMDLLGICMFPLIAGLIQYFDPDPDAQTMRAVWSIAWFASVGLAVWIALLRALFAPTKPWLRLTTLSDETSIFLFKGLRNIGHVTSWGVTALIILKDCTLPESIGLSLAKILALIVHIMVIILILGSRSNVNWALNRAAEHNKRLAPILRFIAKCWWIIAVFFVFALWLVWAAEIPGGYEMILRITGRTLAALIIMRVLSIFAYGGLERFFNSLNNWSVSKETRARILRYYPAAQRVVSFIIIVLTVLALTIAWGTPAYEVIGRHTIGARLLSSLATIIISLLIGVIIWEVANVAIEHKIRQLEEDGTGNYKARTARIRTLQPMLRILLLVVLTAIIGLTVLSQLGINIAPLLAGASIFGVALGFGSQKLVQDFISGLFLLMENALTVGDAVTLNGTYGIVEKLSLRTVHVRANDGSINIFPFSSLGQIINYNRDFARALITADVSYDTDTDLAVQALFDVTKGMRADPDFENLIIDNFQLWGVDSLNDSSVSIKGALPTTTAGRWPVQRQFYRRMKKLFEERGIDIPFPTRTVQFVSDPPVSVSLSNDAQKPNGDSSKKPGQEQTAT
ncbi:mechanosensitive ion channel [Acetobacteraceae bacterium ESL0709]|nr:mechanosensitive ion channel [Acetobacteraceae bacterium ESL0697]MDF7678859.1 mechanosensitive ion channel [Acetobacteraceae bacterium ESL0709]